MEVIKDLYKLKQERGYSYEFLAERTGIEAGTLQKILTGKTKHPRQRTIEALIETYSELYGKLDYLVRFDRSAGVEEDLQGQYTLADWENLPTDTNLELIDGAFYDMGQPSVRHQVIAQEVFSQFRDFIRKNKGKCAPLLSPIGVQIDRDMKSMLEPDLIVICDPNRLGETDGRWLVGEPDFVMEVISESTKKRDMTIKLHKYQTGGVREYWIVDPYREMVIVYDFTAEVTPTIYNFTDRIPVSIYDGKLEIDFNEVTAMLASYYEPWKN